jgi:hypothetical protein
MKKLKNHYDVFPRDPDTLYVIKEIESYLEIKSKDISKMKYVELIEYIDQITLMLLNRKFN